MENLTVAQNHALDAMKEAFKAADGIGMAMNDNTFLRYLRARCVCYIF